MSLFSFPRFRTASFLAAIAVLLSACTPKHDWREVRGTDAPYTVILPGKPMTLSRPVNLDGQQVTMTMTAAEVDGVTFAVGSAVLSDAAKAQAALTAMKTALVRNIGGTIVREAASAAQNVSTIEIEARGSQGGATPQPRLLIARFIAKDNRVYQVAVIGNEKAVSREAADTFLSSFKQH